MSTVARGRILTAAPVNRSAAVNAQLSFWSLCVPWIGGCVDFVNDQLGGLTPTFPAGYGAQPSLRPGSFGEWKMGSQSYYFFPTPGPLAFDTVHSFTAACWVYFPTVPGALYNILAQNRSLSPSWSLTCGATGKWHYNGADTSLSVTAGWTHLTLTCTGTTSFLYAYPLGGAIASSGSLTYSSMSSSGAFAIGGGGTGVQNLTGSVDDVRLYVGRFFTTVDSMNLINESLNGYPTGLNRTRPPVNKVAAPAGGTFDPFCVRGTSTLGVGVY